MNGTIIVQGRELSQKDLEEIRALIASRPEGTRWTLSRELCVAWSWRALNGQLKDMACRAMLKKLEERGLITLPPKGRRPPRKSAQGVVEFRFEQPEAIRVGLDALTPLKVTIAGSRSADGRLLKELLSTYHYLGFRTNVGETIGYVVRDRKDRPVACSVFGAAAWKTVARDQYIDWSPEQRARGLSGIANNHRYLILPWVEVRHLASHVLGLLARRIRDDWMGKYGHPIALLETFVDQSRYRGTCYRAANWRRVGQTTGRSRQDRHHTLSIPINDIYLYPLTVHFREQLRG